MTTTEWKISEVFSTKSFNLTTSGNPLKKSSPKGEVIQFNGIDDGIFINDNPISGLSQFTVEMIFYPESGGQFEQRFLHCGHSQSDRLLLELRSTEDKQWYFDAFISTGESSLALIDKEKLHPSDEWHHVAFVIDNGKISSFVNGIKECEGEMNLTPMRGGQTSFGVRQNKISWFKGAIERLKITPAVLQPEQFLK
jgi:hypothetical protein